MIWRSKDLITDAKKLVKIGVVYGTGFQLEKVTSPRIEAKLKQYPAKMKKPIKGISQYDFLYDNLGKLAGDCCGVWKGYAYGRSSTDQSAIRNSYLDKTISKMVAECTKVTKDYKEALPGYFMWFDDFSHCALYIGDGMCIESTPSKAGLSINPITYQYGGKRWAGYGRLPWVLYGDEVYGYNGDFPTFPIRGYLVMGDTGKQVVRLQKVLNWYGNYKLEEDGIFGKKTDSAVRDFQRIENLKVDGKFGKLSLERIKNIKK